MRYLTGIHALNMPCKLKTCGDWHQSALKWIKLTIRESDEMFFQDWGIEEPRTLPETDLALPVANHIRAILDLLQEGDFTNAQGMNHNFIANEEYDKLVFDLVARMRVLGHWEQIDTFMGKEYMMKWVNYKQRRWQA